MELKELREPVRRIMVKNDLCVLDILATGHNLIKCIESKNWERLKKKTVGFICSYNTLIEELNNKETPVEDKILELEERIEQLKKGGNND